MENSIEETIKIIERKIKEAECYSDITGLCLTLDEELRNALMNILSDYKRVLKEGKKKDELIEKMENCIHILDDELKERNKTINEKEIIIEKLQKENESLKQEITVLQNTKDTCPEFNTSGVRCSLKQENEELKVENSKMRNIELASKNGIVKVTLEGILDMEEKIKNSIPVQKVKDKIEKEIKYHEKNILDIENITMLKGKTAKEEAEIEFNKYAIVVLKKMLQELLEGRK